jgi:hypothetical protein
MPPLQGMDRAPMGYSVEGGADGRDPLRSGYCSCYQPDQDEQKTRLNKNSGASPNAISGRRCHAINPILLDLVAISRGYTSRIWATYQQ